jgi:hypothetical protein
MTKTVQLSRSCKARVWSGQMFTTGFEALGTTTGSSVAASARDRSRDPVVVGVEAVCPRGARAEYGLLGLTFVPDELNRVRLEGSYRGTKGPAWGDALAKRVDQVSIGLPEEYATPVLNALSGAVLGRVSSGVIRVTEAANGLVGSSGPSSASSRGLRSSCCW